MDIVETSTATKADTPATTSSGVGSREPAPEPAIIAVYDGVVNYAAGCLHDMFDRGPFEKAILSHGYYRLCHSNTFNTIDLNSALTLRV